MSREPIILADRSFATKSEAKQFFRQMLYKYELEQMIGQDDQLLLTALLARHRHAADLLSRPIAGFRTAKAELYGGNNRRFEIVREDGSTNDFSYLKCISPPDNAHFQDVVMAMRCEVLEQTRKFHNDAFRGYPAVPCGISNQPVTRKDSQVDHAAPLTFQVLVADFLATIGRRIEDVQIVSEGRHNLCGAKYLVDVGVADQWRQYHQENAHLRVTSKTANLQEKKVKGDFSKIS